jgi:hypothetical protein
MDALNRAVNEAMNEDDPERLTALARDERDRVRAAVAGNSATPPAVLRAMADDPAIGVRAGLAENPATPPEVLARLARDPETHVRTELAKRALPDEVAAILVEDPERDVRIELAQNAELGAAIDARLAADADADVRGYLAGRTEDAELIRRLAADPDPSVVDVVAMNDATPDDVLAPLIERKLPGLRHSARCPPEVLAALASHDDDGVRADVAHNPRTPVEALVRLARDPSEGVRRALCGNRNVVEEVVAILEQDQSETVRRLATGPRRVLFEATLTEPIFLEPRPAEPVRCIRLEVAAAGQGISTIGGGPRLSPGMAIPTCGRCSAPMAMFLQLELAGGIPAHVPAGSRLLVFACVAHDDIPTLLHETEVLPPEYWNLDPHYRLYLAPPGTAAMYAPDKQIEERSLTMAAGTDEIREVGPRSGRFWVGAQGLKIGGVPSWAQRLEKHTCACGAPMRFVAQVPENQTFPRRGADDTALLFLGNEVYFFSCEKACDPRAVWAVVQS